MKKLFYFLFLVNFISCNDKHQKINKTLDYENSINSIQICDILNNNFSSKNESEFALNSILSVIGASKNFIITPCDEINNAVAFQLNGIRYIMYDPEFMSIITDGNEWGNLFILAHEVGHHINGHTIDLSLFNSSETPSITLNQKRRNELEADEFGAFVLAKLGAPISSINNVIKNISVEDEDLFGSHPSTSKRLNAVRIGYEKVKLNIKKQESTTLDFFYRGLDKQAKGDDYEAFRLYSQGIEIGDKLSNIYVQRGTLYSRLYKNYDAALNDYNKAISIQKRWEYYYNRGLLYKDNLKEPKKSLSDFNNALSLIENISAKADEKATINYQKGNVFLLEEQYLNAIESFTVAINLNTGAELSNAYANRGWAKNQLDDYLNAIEDFNQAIEIDKLNTLAYLNRGIAKEMVDDDLIAACIDWKKAGELGNKKALKWVAQDCN